VSTINYRFEPITDDDATLAKALESASVPALMVSLVHITGDMEFLRGRIRPQKAVLGQVDGGLSAEDKAEARARAFEILKAYRAGGCRPPAPLSHEQVLEMMHFLVGEEVPGDYVPMMLEEMALDGEDTRAVHWDRYLRDGTTLAFPVLVIGAGMSGLLAAIRLEEAGISYIVVEKNEAVGGTWYENTYPGCRVDIGNHFYSYSFEPNPDWSEFFSQQEELQEYFERCATDYGVRPHIRFRTEVVSALYDEYEKHWSVVLRTAQGDEETMVASAIVSGVGQLNRPKLPDIKGRETFGGPSFHSAKWEHEHDLVGKRIAVIGTGASALQIVPELGKIAGKLYVFQRSAAWMVPSPNYHRKVSEGMKWLLKHLPYYARWYRFLLFWPGSDGLLPSLIRDPDWPHPDRSVNELNEQQRIVFTEYMRSQVDDDPELLEKIVPSYPPFGKRMLQDNGSWFGTLKRANVELVTGGITEITSGAIVGRDGARIPVDVIVYATGFHANKFLWPMDIVGRGGARLAEVWGEEPRAYLGITVPRFPNLFCLYGPGTNLAHAGSIIFHSECQVRYIMGCIKALVENGRTVMECKQPVHDGYAERLEKTLEATVWSHPGMNSWYKNARGVVTCTSPWRLLDYWRWTQHPDLNDYELS
jgi:4-hydroxyacetophenone monooxygenase